MSKPASENTIKRISDTMGKNITECFPVLLDTVELLSKIKSLIKETNNEDHINILHNQKNILELRSSVLYAILEISVALRADFRSDIAIEKRINLKYLVFIIAEFYKSTFMPEGIRNLWKKVSEYLSSMNVDVINQEISKINDSLRLYKEIYFNKDKDKRDIALHYDFNLDVLYNSVIEISEEEETQRVCAFLAVIQPINNLITSYMSLVHIEELLQIPFKSYKSKEINYEFKTLKKRLYPVAGEKIREFATRIDKNMKLYNIIDVLPDNILSILGEDEIDKIKEICNYNKLGIILHYLYLDLLTALRAYLSSDYFIEKQLNIIRINLIIHEGYKKIYIPINKESKSLWDQYIYSVLCCYGEKNIKAEAESVEFKLQDYKKDKTLVDDEMRHKYIHLRDHKKFILPALLDILLGLNPRNEMNKARSFIQLLSQIIKLSYEATNIKLEIENDVICQQGMKSFNQIKSKMQNLNMKEEDKHRMEETIGDIMNLFD